jgi:hypothetical protein
MQQRTLVFKQPIVRDPTPTYKLGGQRSPWFIDAKKLADYIDSKKREAENDWQKMRA